MRILSKKILLRYVFPFLTVFSAYFSHAQPSLNFVQISPDGGFGTEPVNHIKQDKYGFIWFNVGKTIYRYDGFDYKTYDLFYNDTSGKNEKFSKIQQLGNDWMNRIIVRINDRCYYYDFDNDRFKLLKIIEDKTVPVKNIRGFIRGNDGRFWFVSNDRTGYIDKKGNYHFYSYLPDEYKKNLNILFGLSPNDSTVYLYSSAIDKVFAETDADKKFKAVDFEVANNERIEISGISKDMDGNWWIINNETNRIYKYSPGGRLLTVKKYVDEKFNQRPIYFTNQVFLDKENHLWISTYMGLYQIDARNNSIFTFANANKHPGDLINSSVYCVFEDNFGGMWFGTDNGGLCYYNKLRSHFLSLKLPLPNTSFISSITDICEINQHQTGIASGQNGVWLYDLNTGEIIRLPVSGPHINLEYLDVNTLAANGSTLWMGTANNGIFQYSIRTKAIKNIACYANCRIREMEYINDKCIFVSCDRKRSSFYNPISDSQIPIYIHDLKTDQPVIENSYTCFRELSSGMRLLGSQHGLFYNKESSSVFKPFSELKDYDSKVSASWNVLRIYEDTKKNIWIVTPEELIRINPAKKSLKSLSCGITFSSIAEDQFGDMWLGTRDGLTKLDTETDQFTFYTKDDGLNTVFFNSKAALKTADMLIFGGVNGFVVFNPSEINKQTIIPADIQVNDISIENTPGTKLSYLLLKDNKGNIKGVKVPRGKKIISFKVHSSDYLNPEKIRFRYAINKTRNEAFQTLGRKENTIRLSNLSMGNNVIEIESTFDGKNWSSPIRFEVVVLPPWYLSKLAFFMYLVIISGIFYTTLRFIRYKGRLQREVELERITRENTKSLQEYKSNIFARTANDLRSMADLISSPLKTLQKTMPDNNVYVDIAVKNANRLMLLVNQFSDVQQIERAGYKVVLEKIELKKLIEDICIHFQNISAKKNIKIETTYFNNLTVCIRTDIEKISRIIFSILAFVFKTSETGSSVIISPHIIQSDLYIGFQINGIVLEKDQLSNFFSPYATIVNLKTGKEFNYGLSLTSASELAEVIQGNIQVECLDNLMQVLIVLPAAIAGNDSPDTEKEYNNLAPAEMYVNEAREVPEEFPTITVRPELPNVVLLDPNVDAARYLVNCLEEECNISYFSNGKKALAHIKKYPPDIIISEIELLGLRGIDLLESIKTIPALTGIPFIFLSVVNNSATVLDALRRGAEDYWVKPMDEELLAMKLKTYISFKKKLVSKMTFASNPADFIAKMDQKQKDSILLKKITDEIDRNILDTNYTVDSLSRNLGISRVYIHRKLKQLTGTTASEIIKRQRLKKSVEMIHDSDNHSISEIAYECGFSSPSYFSAIFKKEYGKTPSEYFEEIRSKK